MPIRHVLFDADGVLQELPGGWVAAMEPYLGVRTSDFLHQSWDEELPTLVGKADFLPLLAAALREHDVTQPVEDVFAAVWCRIVPDDASFALVERLRGRGFGVHLATNQEQHRAAYMRTVLGYDDIFGVSCYSYDLGVAKPDPEFFHEAARRIDAAPPEILFIDDNEANVAGARSAGLEAIHWSLAAGHTALHESLAHHGVA